MSVGKKVKSKAMVILYRQLAIMLKTGSSIKEMFQTLREEGGDKSVQQVVVAVNDGLVQGQIPADVLSAIPEVFSETFVDLIRRKVDSKNIAKYLSNTADDLEKRNRINRRLRQAMSYPISIVVVAFFLFYVVLIFVMPAFRAIFADLGCVLPWPTQMMIDLSDFVQSFFWLIVAALFAFMIAVKKSEKFFSRLVSIMPFLGKVLTQRNVVTFLRNLAINLEADIPVANAVKNAAGSVQNVVHRNKLLTVAEGATDFSRLKEAMRRSGMFTSMSLQMIDVGIRSKSMDYVLGELADYYEKEMERHLYATTVGMDLVFMLIIGCVIGFLVIAIYLPLFQMGELIS